MVQAVSRLLLTTEDRIRSQASPCEICGGQCGTGTGNFVLPVGIIQPVLDTQLRLHVALTKGNRGEA